MRRNQRWIQIANRQGCGPDQLRFVSLAAGVFGVAIVSLFDSGKAVAAEPEVEPFVGSWQGKGQINFKDGRREAITCRSYNTKRPNQLRLALRCASSAYKIEIRSRLTFDGAAISGTWEERSFNASGDASGELRDGRIQLKVVGGGFNGDMNIKSAANVLAYSIATTGISMQGVAVEMRRMQ